MTKEQLSKKVMRDSYRKPKAKMTKTREDTSKKDKEFINFGEAFIDEHLEVFKQLAK